MTHASGLSCISSEVAWSPSDGAQLVSFQGKLFLLGGWNQYAGERADLAGVGAGSESDSPHAPTRRMATTRTTATFRLCMGSIIWEPLARGNGTIARSHRTMDA